MRQPYELVDAAGAGWLAGLVCKYANLENLERNYDTLQHACGVPVACFGGNKPDGENGWAGAGS